MKKLFPLMLVLVLLLAACGGQEAPTQTAAAPTQAVTEAPTEVTTVPTEPPLPEKVVYSYVPEQISARTHYPALLEILDEQTIRIHLHKKPLYKIDEIQGLQPGDGIEVGGQIHVVKQLQLTSDDRGDAGTYRKGDLRCEDKTFRLISDSEFKPIPNGFTNAWIDFLCEDSNGDRLVVLTDTFEVKIQDIRYADNVNNKVTVLTGADLMERLKAEPEAFTLSRTSVSLENGQVSSVRLLTMDPSAEGFVIQLPTYYTAE